MKKKRKRKNPEGLLPWEHFQGPPSYKAAHGGLEPGRSGDMKVPDPSDNERIIMMGRLATVEYWADKGDGMKLYYHHYTRPYALLCYGSDDGEHYIVRGKSKYKVTSRGIVG